MFMMNPVLTVNDFICVLDVKYIQYFIRKTCENQQ